MPPSSPTNRKSSNPSPTRNQLVERCFTLRGCEPCKRRKRACNGQKPCTHCLDASQECVYSVISDHPRSVFTTNTARRLSSGSACETCRRRKTKCDGLSPCGFCANNGIECINNSERRKRSLVASSLSNSTTNASSSTTTNTSSNPSDNEAIDRIEDRLRRIEKLMTAFSPSPLSQSTIPPRSTAFRKLSSPHLQKPTLIPPRQQRHSIHNFTSSSSSTSLKDQKSKFILLFAFMETKEFIDKLPYISPPNSNGSIKKSSDAHENKHNSTCNSPSPPLSPRLLKQSLSLSSTNMVASSMLNLSLSPSSSSTSSSSYIHSSFSTPTSPPVNQNNSETQWAATSSSGAQKEWKKSSPIPSLMGKKQRKMGLSVCILTLFFFRL